jgi:hypothetical protein
LKNGGIKLLEAKLDEVKDVGGGVIFIDEAYQLSNDREGKQVSSVKRWNFCPFHENLLLLCDVSFGDFRFYTSFG